MFKHAFILLSLGLFCSSAVAFDHTYSRYGSVLKSYVRDGAVNYAALKQSRATLDAFVNDLSSVPASEYKTWSREQQLAYWINAYNGWFLQIVVNHYPIQGNFFKELIFPKNSVQQIPGIWKGIQTTMADRRVSLDSIEHQILRPQFQEPRIHFAIVCASRGCPLLKSEPYLAPTLNRQLDDSARQFVRNPGKVSVDAVRKRVNLSQIFKWFGEDFTAFQGDASRRLYGEKLGGVIAFLAQYRDEPERSDLLKTKYEVKYLDYDWSLNE